MEAQPRGRRTTILGIVAWVGAAAGVLAVFDFLSARSEHARQGWLVRSGDKFARPPVYGHFSPHLSRWILAGIAVAAVVGLLAWLAGRARVPGKVFVVASVLVFFSLSTAVAFVGGDRVEAAAGMGADIDVPVVERRGVREFVHSYPDLIGREVRGIHAMSHPPGRPLLAWLLHKSFGEHPLAKAVAVAAISSLVLIPVWLLTREMHGEPAARFALVLLASAPGPVMFAFASFEAIEAVFLVTVGWLFIRALRDDGSTMHAVGAGSVLGATMLFTFSTGIVAASLGLYAILTRPRKTALRVLFGATAGGLAALALMRVAIGFDPVAASSATRHLFAGLPPCPPNPGPGTGPCYLQRPYLYWLAGAPAAWLTFAGVALAGLGLRELFGRSRRYLIALAVPPAILYALPRSATGLFPGELERTVLYAFPFVAVAAGAALARLTSERGARVLTVVLVLLAGGQTIVLEALYRTGW